MSTSSLGSNTLRPLHHTQPRTARAGGGRSVNLQQAAFELKQRVFLSLNKLGDRDTYHIGVDELEKVIHGLGPDSISPFLSCITDTDAEQKIAIRKECMRMMGTLARFHGPLVATHLGKMIGSVVKRLKDQDSVVRDACVETVGLLASSPGSCGMNEGGGTFVVLAKPLFEALGEQNRHVQVGAALCLAKVVDDASEVPVSVLPQMLNRIIKLLKNPNFMAKPALVDLIRSIIQAGGASTLQTLSSAMNSVQEALKISDWTTRKAAAMALLRIAAHAGSLLCDLGPFKISTIRSLECCRFDKVKPVRDAAVQALNCWKSLTTSDSPRFSEAGSSKENFNGVDYSDAISASDGGWKDTSFRKPGRSTLSGNSSNSAKRSPLAIRKACQKSVKVHPHSRSNDWHIEVSLPKSCRIPLVDTLCEESGGSCITKNFEHGNGNATIGQENKYDYDLLDDKLECSATSDCVSVSFETKHVTVPRGCLEESNSMSQGNSRFLNDLDNGSGICSSQIKKHDSLNSTVNGTGKMGLSGCCLQSANELSLIRKQLLDIESRQSSLMDLLQVFTGNSLDTLSVLQSKVHNLENAVEKIAQNLFLSGNLNVATTKFLRKDNSVTSSPRLSTCSPRPSVEINYRKSSLSSKNREIWGENVPSKRRSNTAVNEGADVWMDSTFNVVKNQSIKGNQRVSGSGRCQESTDDCQSRKLRNSSSCETKCEKDNSEMRVVVWKRIKHFVCSGDIESAYAEAVKFGDDHMLIQLMDRTGAVLERLSEETANKVLNILSVYILDARYVDFFIPWLQQVVDLSSAKGPGHLHLSRKVRRDFLSAVQDASVTNLPDSPNGETIEQLVLRLRHAWLEVPCRDLSVASALHGNRNVAIKAE